MQTVEQELRKLGQIRALQLPPDLFHGRSPQIIENYRARVASEEIFELRRHPETLRATLLAAYCHLRGGELVDTLVDVTVDVTAAALVEPCRARRPHRRAQDLGAYDGSPPCSAAGPGTADGAYSRQDQACRLRGWRSFETEVGNLRTGKRFTSSGRVSLKHDTYLSTIKHVGRQIVKLSHG